MLAFDAYGRIRGSLPYFESNNRILLVQVPPEPVKTLYARIGDSAGAFYVLLLSGAVTSALINRRKHASSAGA